MVKHIFALGILFLSVIVSILQWRQIGAVRNDISHLQSELQRKTAGWQEAEIVQKEASRTEPTVIRQNASSVPPGLLASRQSNSQASSTGKDSTESVSTALKLKTLRELLGLDDRSSKILEPLLTKYIAKDGETSKNLIQTATDLMKGFIGYDELAKCLRIRKEFRTGPISADIKKHLNGDQTKAFDGFAKNEENNLLQLLADSDFNAWKIVVDFNSEEATQQAYNGFYHRWERRLQSPPDEVRDSGHLNELLLAEHNELLDDFRRFVSKADLELIRTLLSNGREVLVRTRESQSQQ